MQVVRQKTSFVRDDYGKVIRLFNAVERRGTIQQKEGRIVSNTKIKPTLIFFLAFVLVGIHCRKHESLEPVSDAGVIDLTNVQQEISGFGGVNLPGWISDMTDDMIVKAFGTGQGQIGLSILRIRVPYDSAKFSLEVPTAQKAKALGVTQIFASPWTPPAWMKNNNNIVGGTLPDSSFAAYAAHLKSFGDYTAARGVTLYAISIQNEPDVSVDYESCSWNATQMLTFVRYFAPAIGVPVMIPEASDFSHALSDPVLNDPVAASNVFIIGGHIYGGSIPGYPLAVQKGKEVWMTEHLDTDTSYYAVLHTAREIGDCLNAGMNAYVWWYIRRFYGPIDDNGNVTKRGYMMSQFARFVRPGYYKLSLSYNPELYVYVTAFRNNSGGVVVVAVNTGPNPVNRSFTLKNCAVQSVTPYVTSRYKDCEPQAVLNCPGGQLAAALEPYSVTTFVSN